MDPEIISSLIMLSVVLVVPTFRKAVLQLPSVQKVSKPTKRIDYFDFIKGVAIIGVILVHILFFYREIDESINQNTLNFINNIVRYSIGFFFLVSGILLRDDFKDKGSTLSFYKRKLTRIFIPYLVACIFIWQIQDYDFKTFVFNLWTGRASIPYYFVLVILQLYILYPFLVKLRKKSWFLPATLGLSYLFYTVFDVTEYTQFVFFGKFLFFFAYGIAFRDFFLSDREINWKPWMGLVGIYILTTIISPGYYFNVRYFYALALFYLLFAFKSYLEHRAVYKLFTWFGRFSLWIFLTHMTIVSFVYFSIARLELSFGWGFVLNVLFAVPLSILWAFWIGKLYRYLERRALSLF